MRRVALAVVLGSQLGGACHRPQSGSSMQAELREVVPPPRQVEYTRINIAGMVQLPDTRIREVWEGPQVSGDRVIYDVKSYDLTHNGAGDWLSTDRHFFGAEGYGFLGSVDADGQFEPYEPPQILLPPHPKVGMTWSAEHTKGDVTSVRSCEILDSEYCEAGIVVVCDSQRAGGVVVLRDHFCEGLGWGGFEALVQTGTTPSVRMWSEDLVRDGWVIPEPERADAPEPTPEEDPSQQVGSPAAGVEP